MFRADRLTEMPPADCWKALRDHQLRVGRIAFDDGHDEDGKWRSRPMIMPVNYIVDVDRVVIRTAEGAKLSKAHAGAWGAFEIDSISDPEDRPTHAWSVVVRGPMSVITDADVVRYLSLSRLEPDAAGLRLAFIAIQAEEVTGRRF